MGVTWRLFSPDSEEFHPEGMNACRVDSVEEHDNAMLLLADTDHLIEVTGSVQTKNQFRGTMDASRIALSSSVRMPSGLSVQAHATYCISPDLTVCLVFESRSS